MRAELLAVLEALEDVVSRQKVLLVSIDNLIEGGPREVLGALSTLLHHVGDLFEPKWDKVGVLVADGAEFATNFTHGVRT